MRNLTASELSLIVALQQEIATSDLELDERMRLICERVQAMTNSSGAVVEMADRDEMVYRACSGSLAQSVGVRLNIHTSLSGLSVRENKTLHCEDSETDSRVDRETCRRVKARSMVCVPLQHRGQSVGVLKVVSPVSNAFDEGTVAALRLVAGLLSAAIAHASESAEKAAALESLQRSEAKFRTLIELAHDPICISQGGRVVDTNESFNNLFGYTADEVRNIDVMRFYAPCERIEARTIVRENIARTIEAHGLRKDGTSFMMEVTANPIEIAGVICRVTTIRDVTERHRVQVLLLESELRARETARLKADFLATMSHEIRTPINGIVGMADLLTRRMLDNESRLYADTIKQSADDLIVIVNDILDFSKLEAKKLVLERIAFSPRELCEGLERILSVGAADKGLRLEASFAPDLPEAVEGDPTRVRQVLMNLLSNAIKFTNQGTVSLRVRSSQATSGGEVLRFEVADTGIGIPAEALGRMFQPFSQVDASTTRRFGGTGLGLSICRELATAMGGEVNVTSVAGLGSTFTFSVPLVRAASAPKISPIERRYAPARSLKILIAEDNPVNQTIARKMVEKLGHVASVVGDGRQAIEALRVAPCDLVLMDCQMPELDGFDATRLIRAETNSAWSNLPIIAMTANALAGDRDRCLECGMNDYVTKPTKLDDLEAAISRAMAKIPTHGAA